LKKELFGNRMKNFTNQLDDTSQIQKTRKDIARIAGILLERSRAKAAGGSAS
jgi:ribosomal protein L29